MCLNRDEFKREFEFGLKKIQTLEIKVFIYTIIIIISYRNNNREECKIIRMIIDILAKIKNSRFNIR